MSGRRWHHSPAVRYPVVPSRTLAAAGLGVMGLSAAALLAWWAAGAHALWVGGAAWLWLVCAGLALWHWRRSPRGWLCWEAGQWQWQGRPEEGGGAPSWPLLAPRVSVDAGGLLLVHCAPQQRPGRRLDLCLERRTAPQDWGDLRRAVYSAALTPEAAGAVPPPGA